ncbi:MAG: hypothetical protein AAB409_01390 [Gemmatimonadota bacterium]
MRHFAAGIGALAVVVATLACWEAPTAAPGPTPVVSLILVEGESLQVASVTFASPADSTFPPEPVPVPTELVSLRIEDDSGNAWPLTFTGVPGKFSAAMSPRRGQRYRLSGTVMERTIAAETRVPAVFTLLEPAGDTVTAADIVPCQHFEIPGEVCVRLVVAFDGPGFLYCQVQDQTPPLFPYCAFDGTTAELRIDRADRIRDVVFLASNGGAYGWLALPDSPGNVAGAFGGFSAILTFRRKLYVP